MPYATIDVDALRRNAEKAARFSKLCAVVKADAYGFGACRIAELLDDIADCYAVATLTEAEELAACGIEKDILVLGQSRMCGCVPNVIYTVSSFEEIDRLCRLRVPRVAIKINTGMNRFGISPDDAPALLDYASARATVVSVYSHLRDTGNAAMCECQRQLFEQVTKNFHVPRHLSATGGIALGAAYSFDYVRCGIGLYGGAGGFEPVMTVQAPVLEVREVKAGDGVGYGSETFSRDTKVAVIGIGYADGYRRLTARRSVWIRRKKYEVVAVCMDVCMAVVDDDVSCGDVAELLGRHITVNELADSYGTIPYEVFTSIGKRVHRRYGKTGDQGNL